MRRQWWCTSSEPAVDLGSPGGESGSPIAERPWFILMTLMDSDELACRWTWLIMLMEKDDERTGSALAIARRGGRREVEPQRALAGRGGRPHRLAGAMVCVVSSQQSGCFGRAVSGGGGQTVPWNSIHGLRAVKPAAWVSAFKSRELPALSIRCVLRKTQQAVASMPSP